MPERHRKHGISHEHVEGGTICVEGLSYRYPDGTQALEDIHLHVMRGVTLAVIGPNGAGKTTLLKVLLGLLSGYTGTVKIEGLRPEQARHLGIVTWVPQHSHLNTSFPITVSQLARLGLVGKAGILRRLPREDLDYLGRVMDVLKLRQVADRPIGRISGGQMQRALIARALAPRPELVLLDEPMAGIDAVGQEDLRGFLELVKAEFGVTLVMVSHDIRAMLSRSQRIACLDRTLHFHDLPEKLTPEVLSEVFHVTPAEIPFVGGQNRGSEEPQ